MRVFPRRFAFHLGSPGDHSTSPGAQTRSSAPRNLFVGALGAGALALGCESPQSGPVIPARAFGQHPWTTSTPNAADAPPVISADPAVKTPGAILANIGAVDRYIRDSMDAKKITGVSVAVMNEGTVIFARGYGDGEKPDSRFQAASISKAVSALGFVKLAEDGVFSLDDPLSKLGKTPYLPPQEHADAITGRHCLNHTSGLCNDPDGVDRQIMFPPGSEYYYSGGGFLYLQRTVEDITGQPLDVVMADMFRELGMTQTSFALTYEGERHVNAAFSLVTTPSDLARYFNELIHPRPANRAPVEKMTTPARLTGTEPGQYVGLGIRISKRGGDTIFSHSGRNFSAHHSFGVAFKEAGTVVVVQARGEDSRGFPHDVVSRITGVGF